MGSERDQEQTQILALRQQLAQVKAQLEQANAACQAAQQEAQEVRTSALQVSDQQHTKQALVESEHFANKVLAASLNGLYIFDVDEGRIIFINPRYTRLTGYLLEDLQDMTGEKYIDLFHPADTERVLAHIASIKQAPDGTSYEIEYRFKRADGRWMWIHSYESVFLRHKDGRVRQYIGTFIDVTAQKEADAKIEMALAGANAGAWNWNMRSGLVKFSAELYNLLGIAAGHPESRAVRFFRQIYREDRQRVRRAFKAALKDHQPTCTLEFRFTRMNGQVIWLSSTAQIEYDEHKQALRAYGIIQDISQHKLAEAELRASEMRFRQLADSMPQLVWTAGANGVMDYHNWRYREYDGITLNSGSNGNDSWEWTPAVHPDDREATIAAWQQAVQSGEIYQVEHRLRMFDGSYRWHLSRGLPVLDHHNQVVRWFGTATDIHDTKLAEANLRTHNQRLALISDTAAELLRGADPLELIERAFQRLSAMLDLDLYVQYLLSEDGMTLDMVACVGAPKDALGALQHMRLGQGVSGSVATRRRPAMIQNVQNNPEPQFDLIRSLGMEVYASFPLIVHEQLIGTLSFGSRSRKKLKSDEFELLQTVCDLVATAIARARVETALQQYANRLERSNRDLEEFAFVASHDLQEPLRKIEAFGSVLVDCTNNLNEKQLDYLGRMRNAAGRMRTMVDDLLRLSRVNRLNQPFALVDLAQTVKEVLSDLEIQVKRTQGVVEVGELPVVEADPAQMRQLFQNLIGNALKFHRPGVPPMVKISIDTGAAIQGGGQNNRASVQIMLTDNGIGFPEEDAERIFQPFQRLVGRKDFEGSGIGLALCRKIVERHGGSIVAQGQPDQGAAFIITLPVKSGAPARRSYP